MKNPHILHHNDTPSPEKEGHFSQQMAADCDSGMPEMITLIIYATEQDFRQHRPDLRSVPYEAYLRSMAGAVAVAHQRNLPLNIRELRATPYRMWLDRHGLEDIRAHVFLYSCFAPVLRDHRLLRQMGVDPHIVTDSHQATSPAFVTFAAADEVEKLTVRLAVVHRYNEHLSVLTLAYAIARTSLDRQLAVAAWALADQLAVGLPCESVSDALVDSLELGAEWRRIIAERN